MNTTLASIVTCASIVGWVTNGSLAAQQLAPDQIGRAAVPQFVNGVQSFGTFDNGSGKVAAESSQYRADFDKTGIALTTPAQEGAELPRLTLSFLGSSRGFANNPASSNVDPVRSGDFVRYQRGNLVETYESNATGYEQTFHLSQAPAGHGDLVLSIAATGNVHAKAMTAGHQAIEFLHGTTRAIRYSEAFAYDRSGTRIDVMTSYDGAGHIQLIVPQAFLNDATYPIVVDPSVGPVFNPGTATWNDFNPDVAFDPVSEHYLVVWQRNFSSTSTAIRGQMYDKSGGAVGGGWFPIRYSASAPSREPAVAYFEQPGATGFMVVWAESNMIRGQMVNSNTTSLIGTAFNVSDNISGNTDRRPSVSGPGVVTVAWDRVLNGNVDPTEVRLRQLQMPVAGQPMTITGTADQVIEAVTGTGMVRDIRLAQSDVQRTIGGETFYENRVVWQRWYSTPVPGDWDCRTASFSSDPTNHVFNYIQPPGNLATGSSIGPSELRPCLAARATDHTNPTDTQFCVAWEDEGDVHAHMYDLNGPTGSQIIVRGTPEFEGIPAVSAGFCEFVVAYGETIAPNEFSFDIRAARVLLDGTVAITDREVDVQNGPFQNHIRMASRPIQDNGPEINTTLIAWYGATGPTAAGLNDIRARFFEPVAPNASFFGSPCPGPAGELAQIGSAAGPANAGNPDFKITISGAPPFSLAALLISTNLTTTPIPGAPGCSLYAGLPFLTALPTVTSAAGYGEVDLPMPCSIPTGAALAFQWGIYTPGHNAFGWIVSNDLDINWSHN